VNQFPVVLQKGAVAASAGDTLRAATCHQLHRSITDQLSDSQIDIHSVTMLFDLFGRFQQHIRIIPAKLSVSSTMPV
jgi:hypothetical protein